MQQLSHPWNEDDSPAALACMRTTTQNAVKDEGDVSKQWANLMAGMSVMAIGERQFAGVRCAKKRIKVRARRQTSSTRRTHSNRHCDCPISAKSRHDS